MLCEWLQDAERRLQYHAVCATLTAGSDQLTVFLSVHYSIYFYFIYSLATALSMLLRYAHVIKHLELMG